MFPRAHKRRNFSTRQHAARYRSKQFSNPYFRKQKTKNIWPLLIVGLVLGTVIALISFVLTSPILKISSVDIQGLTSIPPVEIRSVVDTYLHTKYWGIIPHSNRLVFREQAVQEALTHSFSFETVSIKKEAHGIQVIVRERQPAFLFERQEKKILADKNGTVIRFLSPEEYAVLINPPPKAGPVREGDASLDTPPSFLIVQDTTHASDISIGTETVSPDTAKAMLAFADRLKQTPWGIRSMEMNRETGTWMTVKTQTGFKILFEPDATIDSQITNLKTIFETSIPDPKVIQYVDLRFGKRVYFK